MTPLREPEISPVDYVVLGAVLACDDWLPDAETDGGRSIILAGAMGLREVRDFLRRGWHWLRAIEGGVDEDPHQFSDALLHHYAKSDFEAWIVERWLKEIRSDAFRESAQCERLMGEWERGR